jgi:hypothetical protein
MQVPLMMSFGYPVEIGALVVAGSLLLWLVFAFAQHFGSLPRESPKRIVASTIMTISIPAIIVGQMFVEARLRESFYGPGPALSFTAVGIQGTIGFCLLIYFIWKHKTRKGPEKRN